MSAPMDERSRTRELLWGVRAMPTRGPKATLSVDRIATAALAIADTEGIEAVSMQRVAEALDFTKMSLYRHVSAKSGLIAVMIELAVGEPPDLRGAREGWQARLERWARQLSATWDAHPWLPAVTAGDRVMGPREMGWVEAAIAALDDTPLTADERMDVVTIISGHLRNTHGLEVAGTQPWHDLTSGELLRTHRDRFPALAGLGIHHIRKPGQTREFGLRCVLDGVARAIEAARPEPRR